MTKYSFTIVSIILCLLFLNLLSNYSDTFKKTESSYTNGYAVNLAKGISTDKIRDVLLLHNYVEDSIDAQFIANQLTYKINCENAVSSKRLTSLYDLQKRDWQISSNVLDSIGSPLFKEKLLQSRNDLGIDNSFKQLKSDTLSSSRSFGKGNGIINVIVKAEDASSYIKKLLHRNYTLCSMVIVRLSEHYLDSLENNKPSRQTICYLKTDSTGQVSFKGLDTSKSYSVIPICKGYEYGTPKGTIGGNLSECDEDGILNCEFSQIEHKIRLFDASTLKQIKEDKTITIRSPKEFKNLFAIYLALFFGAWWGLFFWTSRKKYQINRGIFSILMLLTGFCLLTMFSINNPLTDKLLGIDTAQGIIAGIIAIILILNIDFVKFYQGKFGIGFDVPIECIKWIFKPFSLKVKYLTATLSDKKSNVFFKIIILLIILLCLPFLLLDLIRLTKISDKVNNLLDKLPKGSGYLIVALLLTALLFTPLGIAVGGMKVNLNLGIIFQPSEITKYLIIVFMAAYFSVNANNIVKYSEKGNTSLFGSKLKMLFSIIIGLSILLGLYLGLGDMGPALVLAFTFIILYSIIKSKIDLEGINEQQQLARILTCDLAMLIYGVISFILFLCIGNVIGSMAIGCFAWFIIWIIAGITQKQIFESPILFNLILAAFIFGGSILSDSDISKLKSVGERLENRNEMCTNTWGTLPINGIAADAGKNTQVAEGLWSLASGGLFGQGLGNGTPSFTPAFHTDMILESIGEQTGFVGILILIVLLSLLLRKTIILGYRTAHPFTFYLCLGIAIVTAVQFVIISLGSTGIIPLTGVTVPFLSYGKVSMILNLAAFGVVLSISKHNITDNQEITPEIAKLRKQNIGKYNYSVSILSWIYSFLALFIVSVFFYYQFIDRNDTLIRPVYVNNADGVPVIEYNPRIAEIVRKMHAGDIYDRKGVLLATSDINKINLDPHNDKRNKELDKLSREISIIKDNVSQLTKKRMRRYYPFGEHLFFMLGDFNTKLLFSSGETARGYIAEARHLDELRGYDNKLRDGNGNPIKVNLYTQEYIFNKFLPPYQKDTLLNESRGIQLRDYSALIPYLKDGINSDKLMRVNERRTRLLEFDAIEPKDVHLTIDARLQTELHQKIAEYVNENGWRNNSAWNKLRISVVVLDAEQGDLLASAVYPLPDYDRLKEEAVLDRNLNYRDQNRNNSWTAYSDMDLGLYFPSAPGSTAKIVTSMAGLKKLGTEVATDRNFRFYYDPIEKVGLDPNSLAGTWVTMDDAITWSSNNYVIKLLNTYDLYDELSQIYDIVGARVNNKYSYVLDYPERLPGLVNEEVMSHRELALYRFKEYNDTKTERRSKLKKTDGADPLIDREQIWQIAWGQGILDATPLAMARAASIVANEGKMPITKFVMGEEGQDPIRVIEKSEAEYLKTFMKHEAKSHSKFIRDDIGGKTGTPERPIKTHNVKGRDGTSRTFVDKKMNDGWYICFIYDAIISSNVNGNLKSKKSPLALAVRMERLGSGMSGQAVNLTQGVVLKVLRKLGYLNY